MENDMQLQFPAGLEPGMLWLQSASSQYAEVFVAVWKLHYGSVYRCLTMTEDTEAEIEKKLKCIYYWNLIT